MKKIAIIGLICLLFLNETLAQKAKRDTILPKKGMVKNNLDLHVSVTYAVNYASLTSILLLKIKKVKMFGGFNIAPYIGQQNMNQSFPYLSTHSYYGSVYGGFIKSIKNFDIGLGVEIQKTTKVGDTIYGVKNQPLKVYPRVFVKGFVGKSEFLFTSNLGQRLLDLWGYYVIPANKIDIGLYINMSSLGNGPLIKWGLKKSHIHNFGCSLGYNFIHKNFGLAFMVQNF